MQQRPVIEGITLLLDELSEALKTTDAQVLNAEGVKESFVDLQARCLKIVGYSRFLLDVDFIVGLREFFDKVYSVLWEQGSLKPKPVHLKQPVDMLSSVLGLNSITEPSHFNNIIAPPIPVAGSQLAAINVLKHVIINGLLTEKSRFYKFIKLSNAIGLRQFVNDPLLRESGIRAYVDEDNPLLVRFYKEAYLNVRMFFFISTMYSNLHLPNGDMCLWVPTTRLPAPFNGTIHDMLTIYTTLKKKKFFYSSLMYFNILKWVNMVGEGNKVFIRVLSMQNAVKNEQIQYLAEFTVYDDLTIDISKAPFEFDYEQLPLSNFSDFCYSIISKHVSYVFHKLLESLHDQNHMRYQYHDETCRLVAHFGDDPIHSISFFFDGSFKFFFKPSEIHIDTSEYSKLLVGFEYLILNNTEDFLELAVIQMSQQLLKLEKTIIQKLVARNVAKYGIFLRESQLLLKIGDETLIFDIIIEKQRFSIVYEGEALFSGCVTTLLNCKNCDFNHLVTFAYGILFHRILATDITVNQQWASELVVIDDITQLQFLFLEDVVSFSYHNELIRYSVTDFVNKTEQIIGQHKRNSFISHISDVLGDKVVKKSFGNVTIRFTGIDMTITQDANSVNISFDGMISPEIFDKNINLTRVILYQVRRLFKLKQAEYIVPIFSAVEMALGFVGNLIKLLVNLDNAHFIWNDLDRVVFAVSPAVDIAYMDCGDVARFGRYLKQPKVSKQLLKKYSCVSSISFQILGLNHILIRPLNLDVTLWKNICSKASTTCDIQKIASVLFMFYCLLVQNSISLYLTLLGASVSAMTAMKPVLEGISRNSYEILPKNYRNFTGIFVYAQTCAVECETTREELHTMMEMEGVRIVHVHTIEDGVYQVRFKKHNVERNIRVVESGYIEDDFVLLTEYCESCE
ncbi:hypothetical protein PCE1_002460 [Barthelona sp. PCE]